MELFKRYINGSGVLPAAGETGALLAKYPWFITARLVHGASDRGHDGLLRLSLSTAPVAANKLYKIMMADFGFALGTHDIVTEEKKATTTSAANVPQEDKAAGAPTEEQLIDAFLQKGEYRIVPADSTTDEDIASASAQGGQIVTEQLAGIYLRQGLCDKAISAYEQLSLQNPEKSVYFAQIIDRIKTGI